MANVAAMPDGRPPQGVVDALVTVISERVLSGAYAPGQRLVEAELARDLNAGRSSVREALRRLQASRLIVVEHNRGALVADPGTAEIRAVLEVREVVFGLAARGAAAAQPAQAEAAAALLAEVERELASGEATGHPTRNRAFHDAVHAMSGNPNIGPLMEQFRLPALHELYFRTLDATAFRENVLEHWQICRAIVRADADGAESLARMHERSKIEIAIRLAASLNTRFRQARADRAA